jgi:hypothetical protein
LAEILFIQNDDGNKICAEEKIFEMAQIVEMMEEGLIEEFHWNEAEKVGHREENLNWIKKLI